MPIVRRSRRLLTLGFAAALLGCEDAETINTYEAKRTTPPARAVDAEAIRADLDHMLVAIVPHGDAAWFFKLVARGDAAEQLRKPFEEFIASVEPGEKDAVPSWKLPEGWVAKEGSEMRAATIEVPHEGQKLELAVSTLPKSGDWNKYLTNNVNRWLGQLGEEALDQKTIVGLTRSLPFKGGEATFVELVGHMQATPGMMPAGHPPVAATSQLEKAPPSAAASPPAASGQAATPPSAAGRPMAPPMGGAVAPGSEFAKPAEFTYKPPKGWQPGQTTMMRKAAFVVSEDGGQAGVTVTQFPASGAMSDPAAQAQRWAGEAGLQLSEADLQAAAKEVTIDDGQGQVFELLGPEGEGARGVRAAMVRRGEQMWFFKMSGDRAVVEKQAEPFAEFLKSIKFAGAGS